MLSLLGISSLLPNVARSVTRASNIIRVAEGASGGTAINLQGLFRKYRKNFISPRLRDHALNENNVLKRLKVTFAGLINSESHTI